MGDYVTCVQHFKVQQKGHVLVYFEKNEALVAALTIVPRT